MVSSTKKPLILLLLQGFGLSSTWPGNAIASASLKSFDKLWQKYDHAVLKPLLPSSSLSERFYYDSFYQDTAPRPDYELVNDFIADYRPGKAEFLDLLIGQILKNSSKLHLVLSLSEDDCFGSIKQLISFVKLAKRSGIFRREIHLLVDEFKSPEILLRQLDQLDHELASIDNQGISTISPLSNLWSRSGINSTLSLLLKSKGKRILSAKQCQQSEGGRRQVLQNYILTNNKNFSISDFDGVLFVDYNPEMVTPLIEQFSMSSDIKAGRPKYVEIATITANLIRKERQKKSAKTLIHQLTEVKKNVSVIADDRALELMSLPQKTSSQCKIFSLDDQVLSSLSMDDKIKKILNLVERKIKQKKDDFVVIDFPFIVEACQYCRFEKAVEVVKKLDNFLFTLESIILKGDGTIIISSLYGMAEHIETILAPSGKRAMFSSNPLPLIILSSSSQKKSAKFGILDLMSPKYDIGYLKKIIKENLRLEN